MSLRLLLICSASTNAVRTAAFPVDEPLDAKGRASAAALSGELAGFAVVSTSPALRARGTAASLGLAASVDPALRDLDVGRWAGRSLTEIEAAEPAGLAAWISTSMPRLMAARRLPRSWSGPGSGSTPAAPVEGGSLP